MTTSTSYTQNFLGNAGGAAIATPEGRSKVAQSEAAGFQSAGMQKLLDTLFTSGAAQGDREYWRTDRGAENSDLGSAAIKGLQGDQRGQILDSLFNQGFAQGDRSYWDQSRGGEEEDIYNVIRKLFGGGTATSPESDSGGGTAPGGRQGIVDMLFGSGAATGDAGYWYQDRGSENESLYNAAVAGLAGPQRSQILDYLFSTGLAQGDRAYWDENRGAEEGNLEAILQKALGFKPAAAGDTGGGGEETPRDLESLRAARLEAALAAIGAQFDMQGGELRGEKAALKNEFDVGMFDLKELYRSNQEQIGDAAANRGILRSGVYAEQQAEETGRFGRAEGLLEGSLGYGEGKEGTQVRSIMSALGLLGQQRAGAEAEAKMQSERDELDVGQLVAMITAGLG